MADAGFRRGVRVLVTFLHDLLLRFDEDRCPTVAAALSFITVFSLVPASAVVLPLLGAFPHFGDAWSAIQDFIFVNFVPETGAVILQHLREYSSRAARLSVIGILTLAVTLTVTLGTIEQVFNRIWRVRVGRPLASRLLMYWAMLTVGPLLLGAGFIATSRIVSLPLLHGATSLFEPRGWCLRGLIWLTTLLAFFLLYFFVPNRKVSPRHALAASVAATVLFELAKKSFAVYLAHFSAYQTLFGAFAGVPLFLMWVYISWVITLLGAEFACCLTNHQAGHRVRHDPSMGLVYAARLAQQLRHAQSAGRPLALDELHQVGFGIPWEEAPELIDRFEQAGIVHRTASGRYAPSWNMEDLTLAKLQAALDGPLPDPDASWAQRDEGGRRLAVCVRAAREGVEEAFDMTLKQL